jgi:hypothetical protein
MITGEQSSMVVVSKGIDPFRKNKRAAPATSDPQGLEKCEKTVRSEIRGEN